MEQPDCSLTGSLVAFCNPLLDIIANVDSQVLERYELKANDAILAKDQHLPLYEELVNKHAAIYTAGGAAQNSMRAAQWLLPAGSTVYVGCIGSDKFGEQLRQVAQQDGLHVEYMVVEHAPTGTCACLITENGQHRSLVANLGAANHYKIHHVLQPHMEEVLLKTRCILISGYFLTVSPETILHVAQLGNQNHKASLNLLVCLNLSAPFICECFTKPLLDTLPYVDYLFGNEAECRALGKALGLESEEIPEIALHLSQMPKVRPNPRHVIITQGPDPTICVIDGRTLSFPTAPIPPKEIVDTTGAGDAFVGGFLSQLVQQKPLPACVKAGQYVAGVIIRRSGVTFGDKPNIYFD